MQNAHILISEGYMGQYKRTFEPKTIGKKTGGWLHMAGVGKFWVNKTQNGYNIHGKECATLSDVVKWAEENLIDGNY